MANQPGNVWTEERIAALRMVRCLEFGSRTLNRIFDAYPDSRVFLESESAWTDLRLNAGQKTSLARSIRNPIEPLLKELERDNTRFLLPVDEEFPDVLKQTSDPPASLFVRGAECVIGEIRIAIVGTRKPTSYGRHCATFFGRELAQAGFTIVSGLALGIDGCSHKGCLEAGAKTVAVLPGGTDDPSIVPQTHLKLAHLILEHGGSIVSENPPGTPTLPFQFLTRNRLIAGLARATIVVEAPHESGALTTAKCAAEEGREVLAVPGSILSEFSRGCHALIRDGAKPCTTVDDVISALNLKSAKETARIREARSTLPVSRDESLILAGLAEPKSVDDLARVSGLAMAKTNALLSILELKGIVIAVGPKTYAKTKI